MCFSVIAGKNTTIDGNCLLGVNNDWTGYPGTIKYIESKKRNANDFHTLVSGGRIPNVEKTFSYLHTATSYDTGILKNNSWWGGVNENKVAVGIQGVYSFENLGDNNDSSLETDDIPILILERAKSSRHAVELIGKLIDKYGFKVSSIEGGEGVCNVSIVDPNEGFFFEVGPGGYWAAKKVKDDEIEVRPNCFGIQEIDFSDKENFIVSDNLLEKARETGKYKDEDVFNFHKIFSTDTSVSDYYGTALDPENSMRKWHSLNYFGKEDINLEEMRYHTKPLKKVSAREIMDLLSLSSEGTKYDLTKKIESGQHNNPYWMEVSTSVGQAGTVVSSVFQLRDKFPSDIGIVAWFALSNPKLSPFVPFYFGSKGLPKSYNNAKLAYYDNNSAWWNFHELGQLCYRNYEIAAKQIVIPRIEELENNILKNQKKLDEYFLELYIENKENALSFIKQFSYSQASNGLELSKELGHFIKSRIISNTYINF